MEGLTAHGVPIEILRVDIESVHNEKELVIRYILRVFQFR